MTHTADLHIHETLLPIRGFHWSVNFREESCQVKLLIP